MNRCALLVFSVAVLVVAAGCQKDETTSRDANLAGVNVAVGEKDGAFSKLFVLNEGNFQKNNSTLDFFRFSDGNYVSDAFGSMNPSVVQGLGDTGNDLALKNGKLWLVMNGSGYVHVLDGKDETLLASIPVPDPRFIAFDSYHAYVTSYDGAIYGGEEKKGKVYRISLDSYKIDGEVEVGFQPEGISIGGGKVYVANSGGYNSVHGNTLSVIDPGTFKVTGEKSVPSNPRFVYANNDGRVWVSSYGESSWSQDSAGNWIQSMSEPMGLYLIDGRESGGGKNNSGPVEGVHVNCMTVANGYIYAIGNAEEMTGGFNNTLYKVPVSGGRMEFFSFSNTQLSAIGNPYGICVNIDNGDIYIADADYTGPGKVWCFTKDLKLKWSAVAGMLPAHMVLY